MSSESLTREDLYAQVWAEPTTHVAKRLGLSDRGLGKLPHPRSSTLEGTYAERHQPEAPLLSMKDEPAA